MGPEHVPKPPTTAPPSARFVPEPGSWWDYVDSRDRAGGHGKAGAQSAGRVSSDAFAMHMRSMRRRAHPMCRYCATSLDERVEWRRSVVERDEWLMRPDERRLMMR